MNDQKCITLPTLLMLEKALASIEILNVSISNMVEVFYGLFWHQINGLLSGPEYVGMGCGCRFKRFELLNTYFYGVPSYDVQCWSMLLWTSGIMVSLIK